MTIHKKAKHSNDQLDWSALRRVKNEMTTAIRTAKKKSFMSPFEKTMVIPTRKKKKKKNSTGVTFLLDDDSEHGTKPFLPWHLISSLLVLLRDV